MDTVTPALPTTTVRVTMHCPHCARPVHLRTSATFDGNRLTVDTEHAHLAVAAHYRQHQ